MEENEKIPGFSQDSSPNPEEMMPVSSGTSEKAIIEATEQQTKEMETHAHHLHHAPGKKFWHYFYEFLMLFLAVFCGFLAENWREHLVESQREKQFILSYMEDLKIDTGNISSNILLRNQKIRDLGTLIELINGPDPNQHSSQIYLLARQLTRTNRFIYSDRTIKQLKNSGGLRLIRNQQASDSIMAYDEAMDRFNYSQDRQTNEILAISPLMGKLLNANVLETMITGQSIQAREGNPPLRSIDKDLVLDFSYGVHQLKTSDVYLVSAMEKLKSRAVNILLFLKKEYHLE